MSPIPKSSGAPTTIGVLESLIRKSQNLGQLILSCREEIDSERQLPANLVEELRRSGFFRLFVPAEFGGYEVDPITFVKIIEEISMWLCQEPRKGCVKKTRNRHAVRKMEVGPPEPPCRRGLQTAVSCFSQKLRW